MYKLNKNTMNGEVCSVNKTNEDGSMMSIPFDPANTDYREYLKWVAEGNTPSPAESVDTQPADE
jgi:hypothetical protein